MLRGLSLPPLTSRIGREATRLWAAVLEREQHAELAQLTEYLPAIIHIMAGMDPTVSMEARYHMLSGVTQEVYDAVDYTRYTAEKQRERIARARSAMEREHEFEEALADIQHLDDL